MKQLYGELKNPTYLTHRVADQKRFQNYHLSVSHKTTEEDPLRDPQEAEDSQEDSQEAEDSQEVEDSPEEEDTQAVAEYHREDHPEEDGDHHQSPCPKLNKES